MRRAEWRSRENEHGDSAEFLRNVPREITFHAPWAATLGHNALYLGPTLAFFLLTTLAGGPCLGIPAGLIFLAFYSKLIEFWKDRATPRSLGAYERILPLPLPADTFPITVTLRRGNSITGIDEATVAFVEGWLVVEGKRTSFSLRASDARAELRQDTLRIALPEFQTVTLDLVTNLNLDVRPAGYRYVASHRIAAAERTTGEPILPPLGTLPLVARGWNALGIGGFVLAATMGALDRWIDLGVLSIPAIILMSIGAIAFCRALFIVKGQEEADQRAEAIGAPAVPRIERCHS